MWLLFTVVLPSLPLLALQSRTQNLKKNKNQQKTSIKNNFPQTPQFIFILFGFCTAKNCPTYCRILTHIEQFEKFSIIPI